MTYEMTSIADTIFIGDSKMAKLMRSHDWSATPVGRVETWSQSLKTAIRIILGSPHPMCVWWGTSKISFYNDAYATILGQRHSQALGQSAFVVWADIWHPLICLMIVGVECLYSGPGSEFIFAYCSFTNILRSQSRQGGTCMVSCRGNVTRL